MLKIMNPFQREPMDNESVAFRVSPMACTCNSEMNNYTAVMQIAPPGSGRCACSCIGTDNLTANKTRAFDYEAGL